MSKIIKLANKVLIEMDEYYWKNVGIFIGLISEEVEKYPNINTDFCELIIANIEIQELRHEGYQSILKNKDNPKNIEEIIGQIKVLLAISEDNVKSLETLFYEKLKTFKPNESKNVINLYNLLLKILNPKTQKETCEKVLIPKEKCVS